MWTIHTSQHKKTAQFFFEKGEKAWIDIFPKNTYQWQRCTWEGVYAANHQRNVAQKHNNLLPHIHHYGYNQENLQVTNSKEGVEKGKSLTLLMGGKLVLPLWKTVWRLPEKLKIELPYDLARPPLGK